MLPDICINNYIFDLEKTIIMKERILKGWSLKRILLVVFGLYIIYQSVTDKSWADVAIGTYFISMGVFAFGCASGNCYSNSCAVKSDTKRTII